MHKFDISFRRFGSVTAGMMLLLVSGWAQATYSSMVGGCTPGVEFASVGQTISNPEPGYASSGFTLGCMSPALWAVLSVQSKLDTDGKVRFEGSGTAVTENLYGNVGAFGGSVTVAKGASVHGDVVGTTGQWPSSSATKISVDKDSSIVGEAGYDDYLLAAARNDAFAALQALDALKGASGVPSLGKIDDSFTITAKTGGLNVVNISSIDLGKNEVLRFDTGGFTDVSFVVNIGGNFKVDQGGVEFISAALPGNNLVFTDVLFNVGGDVQFKNNKDIGVTGIVLAMTGKVEFAGGLLDGTVIGGKNMTFTGGSVVRNPNDPGPYGCMFTAENPDIPTCIVFKAPEPGTLALLLIGLGAAVGFGRRRLRKTA